MAPSIGVPRWLGFSWWWLLGAIVLANVFRTYLSYPSYFLIALIFVWSLVQPAWLRVAYPVSRAVYWYLSGFCLFALLKVLEHFEGPAAFLGDSWVGAILTLAIASCHIAGACYFAGELREFLPHSQGYDAPINYVWPIFFGMYYFQYKLHEAHEDQRAKAERLTPGPA